MTDTNTLISYYIQLRDRKKEMQMRHKEELEPIEGGLMKLEGMMQERLNDMGVEKMGGDTGTVFTKVNTSITVEDWESVLGYIKSNDAFDILDRRVNKTAAQERGDVPGLRTSQIKTIQVRRK